jgi:hypothetical protein
VAALLRDSESYQSIAPSLMGRSYRLVLGKHSGRQAVNGVFDQMGYHLNAAQINQLLPAIRRFAENWKRSPKDYELVAIYDELCGESALRARGNDGVVLSNSRRGRTSLRRIFFQFFAVPYQPELLGRCSLPVLATFHRKLRARCRCKTGSRITTARPGCWREDCSRRAISNSFRRAEHETEIHL